MPWPRRTSAAVTQLRRELDSSRTTICSLRRELENKEGAVGRLELVLRERLETIDALRSKLDQLRATNQKLDAECESYFQMLAAG